MPRRVLPWKIAFYFKGICILAALSISACAHVSNTRGLPLSPNARFYAYLVSHGMARGAIMTGQVSRETLPDIATADRNAQHAVLSALLHASQANDARADGALAGLLQTLPQ